MLFELLVLSGAQVGSDWTSILKKRQDFRDAFSGFDAEAVANLTDKQMISICSEYGIDISRVRGVVDNSNRILEVIPSIKFCNLLFSSNSIYQSFKSSLSPFFKEPSFS